MPLKINLFAQFHRKLNFCGAQVCFDTLHSSKFNFLELVQKSSILKGIFSQNCRTFLLVVLLILTSTKSFAAEEFLPESQEKRAQNLFLQVKCLVCQGQVIESSNTQIAFELRKLIRQKITDGLSDNEIKEYLVSNYGSEVLTSPPLNNQTLFLWILPLLILVMGGFYLMRKILKGHQS